MIIQRDADVVVDGDVDQPETIPRSDGLASALDLQAATHSPGYDSATDALDDGCRSAPVRLRKGECASPPPEDDSYG